jgi:hypothetical protein
VTWPGGPAFAPPPPPRRTGRTAAIVLGITVPILVIILAVAGFLFAPRLLGDAPVAAPTPTPSTTTDPFAVPEVGTCFSSARSYENVRTNAEQDRVVPCEERHAMEVVASGPLDGPRPSEGSDAARGLYEDCTSSAEHYLGMPWFTARTWLVVSLPSADAWADGAQWYRCDLITTDEFGFGGPELTTGSIRDTATPVTCLTFMRSDDNLSQIDTSECDVLHQGELAGGFWGGDIARDSEDAYFAELSVRCEPLVRDFLGQEEIHPDLTFWYFYTDPEDVNQSVKCVLTAAEDRSFTASLAGLGSGAIPFA